MRDLVGYLLIGGGLAALVYLEVKYYRGVRKDAREWAEQNKKAN
jgi:hypothetical protein